MRRGNIHTGDKRFFQRNQRSARFGPRPAKKDFPTLNGLPLWDGASYPRATYADRKAAKWAAENSANPATEPFFMGVVVYRPHADTRRRNGFDLQPAKRDPAVGREDDRLY